jgi:Rrf2 family nitric oxide-sensitive transcriptional repressor
MRLTRFTDYSLRVLIYLGQNNDSRVTINQISQDYDISKNHLMKVVSNLTRWKFVAAQRGPGGGIQLNRPAEEINLGEVISVTEKYLRELDVPGSHDADQLNADSRLSVFLHHALQAYLETLDCFTLADVLKPNSEAHKLVQLNVEVA